MVLEVLLLFQVMWWPPQSLCSNKCREKRVYFYNLRSFFLRLIIMYLYNIVFFQPLFTTLFLHPFQQLNNLQLHLTYWL